MPWDRSAPTNPKYRGAEHRQQTALLKRQFQRHGYLVCAAAVCLFDSRYITNPNGRDDDGLTAGHTPDGVTYNGPEHRACNLHEAAVRARARQMGTEQPKRWVV